MQDNKLGSTEQNGQKKGIIQSVAEMVTETLARRRRKADAQPLLCKNRWEARKIYGAVNKYITSPCRVGGKWLLIKRDRKDGRQAIVDGSRSITFNYPEKNQFQLMCNRGTGSII